MGRNLEDKRISFADFSHVSIADFSLADFVDLSHARQFASELALTRSYFLTLSITSKLVLHSLNRKVGVAFIPHARKLEQAPFLSLNRNVDFVYFSLARQISSKLDLRSLNRKVARCLYSMLRNYKSRRTEV